MFKSLWEGFVKGCREGWQDMRWHNINGVVLQNFPDSMWHKYDWKEVKRTTLRDKEWGLNAGKEVVYECGKCGKTFIGIGFSRYSEALKTSFPVIDKWYIFIK